MPNWDAIRRRVQAALDQSGYRGGRLTPRQAAAGAEAAGMPGQAMSQVYHGESDFDPTAIGHDPGGTRGLGLGQVTTKYNDDVIRQFGGEHAMLDPVNNLLAQRMIYDRQGIKAWYGTKYLTDPNAHYSGQLPSGGGAAAPAASVGGGTPQAPAQNPFSMISSLSQPQQDNPYAATLQRGWDLLGQIWDQKYGGQQQSSPSLLSTAMGGDRAGGSIAPSGEVGQYIARANKLDKAHMPYLLGGGHGSTPVDPNNPTPVDCSGAVSSVLGIDPRVSGQFESWGKAGEGGKKGVTIYANDHHVLMKINGHFFGTSASNPGRGAGWIPQNVIGRDYLKNFTARHL